MSDRSLNFPVVLGGLPSSQGISPLTYGLGAWSDHLPFAFDLIATLRPRLLVELGTFSGESYFGFCQAVRQYGTGTSCYAVDTWRGDDHTGPMDESCYLAVDINNQRHYSAFSYLVRGTFDEARSQFTERTIDLLHIDGAHDYESVRHDFETWLEKVVPGGIILFHDIAARHDNFGVWKLWDEIIPHGAGSFAFRQGWGLGVWRKPWSGEDPAPPANPYLDMLFSGDPERQEAIRSHYVLSARELRTRMTYTPPPTPSPPRRSRPSRPRSRRF